MAPSKERKKKENSFIVIADKEQRLFIHIHDMVFVDIEYCQKNIYLKEDGSPYSYVWVTRALKKLADAGYLKTWLVGMEGKPSGKRIYTLDKKGVEEVEAIIGESHWDMRWTERTPTHIHHSLRACEIRAAYEAPRQQKENDTYFQFYEWVSERHAYHQYGDSKKEAIRPDGAMIFERQMKDKVVYVPYFIEIERSRQSAKVSQQKCQRFNAYAKQEAYLHHSGLDVPVQMGPRILFISNTENEMQRLMAHTEGVSTTNATVLYTTYAWLLDKPYGAIWQAKDSADPERLYHFAEKVKKA